MAIKQVERGQRHYHVWVSPADSPRTLIQQDGAYINNRTAYNHALDCGGLVMACRLGVECANLDAPRELPRERGRTRVKPSAQRYPRAVTPQRCALCGQVKDADDFYTARHKRNGLNSHCKLCHKVGVKKAKARREGREYKAKRPPGRPRKRAA